MHIEGNTVPAPGEAYQVPIMSYAHTKQTSKCPRGESGGGLKNFKVRKTNQTFNYFLF